MKNYSKNTFNHYIILKPDDLTTTNYDVLYHLANSSDSCPDFEWNTAAPLVDGVHDKPK